LTSIQLPLRHLRREDLEPAASPTVLPSVPLLLDVVENAQLDKFCQAFSQYGHYEFSVPLDDASGHLRMFIGILATLGVARISCQGGSVVVDQGGRLARHVPQILKAYLDRRHVLIEDWNRLGVRREDQLNAVDLVHQLELRRIELERRSGSFPEPMAERPVAFGIFRALNNKGESCYLFENNRDWQRLNLIGGKQEPEDGGDFSSTLKREIFEELGISPRRVVLSRLNEDPIVGYGLSGNVGSLARYPCVLFGVTVEGPFGVRPQDTWITEDTIRHYLRATECPIMVNPEYLAFLLSGNPSRLERCPLTTLVVADGGDPGGTHVQWINMTAARYVRDNKELVAAVLTLVATLITAVLAL
jgi:8-oxo-dGTP pyrophosphatase MutT (NUDIX family)